MVSSVLAMLLDLQNLRSVVRLALGGLPMVNHFSRLQRSPEDLLFDHDTVFHDVLAVPQHLDVTVTSYPPAPLPCRIPGTPHLLRLLSSNLFGSPSVLRAIAPVVISRDFRHHLWAPHRAPLSPTVIPVVWVVDPDVMAMEKPSPAHAPSPGNGTTTTTTAKRRIPCIASTLPLLLLLPHSDLL